MSFVFKKFKGFWCLIFYLLYFYKKFNFINVGIFDEFLVVYFVGIYEVILYIKIFDIYIFFCKIDFRFVFRILLVNFNDFELLGISGVEIFFMVNVYLLVIV